VTAVRAWTIRIGGGHVLVSGPTQETPVRVLEAEPVLDLLEGFYQDCSEGVVYPARADEAGELLRAHGREVGS